MNQVYTIEDGRIAGSPGPTRIEWDLAAIKAAGFSVVISFECDRLDLRAIRAADLEHKLICVDDFTAPTIDQLVEFNEFVDRKLKEGKKVLAHCYAGRGRTGTFLASRLIWRGKSVADAVGEVRGKIIDAQGTLAGAIEPVQMEALHYFARNVHGRSSSAAKPK